MSRARPLLALVVTFLVLAAGCSSSTDDTGAESGTDTADGSDADTSQADDGAADTGTDSDRDSDRDADTGSEVSQPGMGAGIDLATIPRGEVRTFPSAPDYPDGPWSAETGQTLGTVVATLQIGLNPEVELQALADTGDPRLAWALADLLRFIPSGAISSSIAHATEQLLGIELDRSRPWHDTIDHLIAWDLPVPPGYFTFKRDFYGRVDPRWAELFTDINTIDWRLVSWGGVPIDDRPGGDNSPCACIPALDDPGVTSASEGDWYPDDAVVFALVINGEARAYPKNIMEVHEMVNDTLGGRRIAMPYCTLCGSAQAYLTDELGPEYEQPVFRTSGLLIRSNKMMYELTTKSFVDTFLGVATSGPLGEAGISFDQVSVVTTTWGQWRAEHPETTIVAEDGGIGRQYAADPLRGRDDDGPIFPIGPSDDRLPVQEPVLGLFDDDGTAVAVHVASARQALEDGQEIMIGDSTLSLDGGGIRAVDASGDDVGAHQAFWFAWSQYHPRTRLWPHDY